MKTKCRLSLSTENSKSCETIRKAKSSKMDINTEFAMLENIPSTNF